MHQHVVRKQQRIPGGATWTLVYQLWLFHLQALTTAVAVDFVLEGSEEANIRPPTRYRSGGPPANCEALMMNLYTIYIHNWAPTCICFKILWISTLKYLSDDTENILFLTRKEMPATSTAHVPCVTYSNKNIPMLGCFFGLCTWVNCFLSDGDFFGSHRHWGTIVGNLVPQTRRNSIFVVGPTHRGMTIMHHVASYIVY